MAPLRNRRQSQHLELKPMHATDKSFSIINKVAEKSSFHIPELYFLSHWVELFIVHTKFIIL